MKVRLWVSGAHRVPIQKTCASFRHAHLQANLLVALLPGYSWFQVGFGSSYWDSRHFLTTEYERRFYMHITQQKKWNPKYVAWANSLGVTPEQAWEVQAQSGWVAFQLWISERKQAFYLETPGAFLDRWTIADYEAWDRFLGVPA